MSETDLQGGWACRKGLRRSLLSITRDQFQPMEVVRTPTGIDIEVEVFQKRVAERFNDLSGKDELLSIQWVRKLLDIFLCCQEDFRAVLFNNRGMLNRPPIDRYVTDYFDRSVKALDICNAIRDGIEQIRQWQKQSEIVLCALDTQRSLGEGQFRRAKKALIDLVICMLDEKESADARAHSYRNRSFGRHIAQKDHRSFGHFRSLSWSVSRLWSAAKQLHAIGSNLAAPRTNEIAITNGLAAAVFTMNYVLFFVMWALVAAIPCQDRGLQTYFLSARQYPWAIPIYSLHERIMEASKRKDRKNSCGLLKEIHEIEKCARLMNELIDSVQFPLTAEKEIEVRQRVEELGFVYAMVKDGLDPLERQVREVFHRIVRSRTDGLDSIARTSYQE